MTRLLVRSVELFFQEGTSDKLYIARLVETEPGKHDVEVEWGRRGAALNRGKKAVGVPLPVAEKTFERLVREKTGKGYEAIAGDVKPAAEAPPEGEGSGSKVAGRRPRVGRIAQLLNAIDEQELTALFADEGVVAQQKLDGVRVIVHVTESGPIATNRAGETTRVASELTCGLSHLPLGTIVDGEVVGAGAAGVYWLFDLLALGDTDLTAAPYLARWERLDGEVEPGLFGPIRVLPVARGTAAKSALFEELRAASAEGIVFKSSEAPYRGGRPSSGGPQLKHKFVKSADVVITENAGNAYRMVVVDGAGRKDVGKVFAGTTNETRRELDLLLARGETPVCEVKYLYATDDEKLYQPVFVRIRDDKAPDECHASQLARTSRDVLGHRA